MESAAAIVPLFVGVLAAASIVLTVLLGIILAFHWFRYAMNPAATMVALVLYLGISATLISGMLAGLVVFTASL